MSWTLKQGERRTGAVLEEQVSKGQRRKSMAKVSVEQKSQGHFSLANEKAHSHFPNIAF